MAWEEQQQGKQQQGKQHEEYRQWQPQNKLKGKASPGRLPREAARPEQQQMGQPSAPFLCYLDEPSPKSSNLLSLSLGSWLVTGASVETI